MAQRILATLPETMKHIESYAEDAMDIRNTLSERMKQLTGRTPRIEGKDTGDWVLIDTGDLIIHIFRPEVRQFYNLEKMWVVWRTYNLETGNASSKEFQDLLKIENFILPV